MAFSTGWRLCGIWLIKRILKTETYVSISFLDPMEDKDLKSHNVDILTLYIYICGGYEF